MIRRSFILFSINTTTSSSNLAHGTNSGESNGKNGFEKDKSPEATEDSPDNPDEYKTHITDAWDTLFVGANFFMPELAYAESGIIFLH